jgi:hypothetical protein
MRRMGRIVLVCALLISCKNEPPNVNANATLRLRGADAAPLRVSGENAGVDAAVKVPVASPGDEAAFWRWFKDHRVEVGKVKRADEPIAKQLASELHKVDPRLIFELGIGTEPKELIISADGIREVFPAVKRLVAAAPAIPGWKVVAFRPRKGAGLTIEVGGGTKLGADDLYFVVLPTAKPPAPVDLMLYVPGLGGPDDEAVKQVSYLLLDATLGEHDVETKVGGIALKPASEKPASAKPLRDLPRLVDAWK